MLRLRRGRRRAGLHPADRGPDAARGHRAAGRQPRACAQGRHRPARTRRPASAALAPRDPALLTAAARFYAGCLRRSTEAREYLASRGVGPVAADRLYSRLLAGRRSAAGPGVPRLLREAHQGLRAVHGAGRAVRRHGGRSRPRRRPRPLAEGPGPGLRRREGPGSRPFPAPSRCSDSAGSAPLPRGSSWPRASSTGSPLPDGAFPSALPWAPRALSASPRPSGAAPASSSPSTATTRGGGDGRASDPARTQGRRRHPPRRHRRRGRACCPSPRPERLPPPALAGGPLRPLAAPRRFQTGIPARLSLPQLPLQRSCTAPLPCGPSPACFPPPLSLPQEVLCPFHDGPCPLTDSRRGVRPSVIRYRNEHQGRRTRDVQQERKQQRRPRGRRRSRLAQRQRAQARRRHPRRARAALGRAPARRHAGAHRAPERGAGLPAQGAQGPRLRLPRRPRGHRPGQPRFSATAAGATSWSET